jgi:hypothetical protein
MIAANARMGGSMTAIVTPTLMNVLPMMVKDSVKMGQHAARWASVIIHAPAL